MKRSACSAMAALMGSAGVLGQLARPAVALDEQVDLGGDERVRVLGREP